MNLDAAIRAHAVDGADALAAGAAGGDADSLLFSWRWLKWLTATHAIGEAVVIVVVAGASIAGLVKLLAVARQTWIAKTNTPAHGVGGVKYGRVTSVSRPVFQPADPNRGLRRAALASGSSSLSGAATPRRGLNDAIGSAPAAASALRTANGSDSLARKSASVAFADDVDARARRAVEGTAALPPLPVAPSSSLLATSRNATTPRSMTSTQLQHYHQSAVHDASQYSGHADDGTMTMLPPPQVVFAPVELGGGGRPSSKRSTSAAKKATHRRRQSKSHEAADDRGAGKKHATSVVAPKPSAAFVAEPTRQRAGGRPSASGDADDFAMPPPTAGGFDVPPDVEPVDESVGAIDLLPAPAGRRHRKDGPQADTGMTSSGGTAKPTPRRSRQGDAESAEEALYREPWAVALGVAGPPRQTHRREPLNDAASAAAAAGIDSSDGSDGGGSASGTPKMGASSFTDGAAGLGIFVGPGSKRPAEAPSAPIRFDFDKYHVSLGELVVRPPTPPPPPPPAPTASTAAPAQTKSPVASTQQDPKPPASTAFGPSKRAVAAPSKEVGAMDKVTAVSSPFGQAAKEDTKNSPQQKASDAPKSSPFGRPQAPAAAAAPSEEDDASSPDTKPTDDGAAKDDDRKPVKAAGDEQASTKPWSKPFGSNAPSAPAKDAADPSAASPADTAPSKAPGTPGAKAAGKGLGAMNVAFNSPRKPPAIPKPPEGGGGGGWGKPKTAVTADTAAGPAAAPKLSNDQKAPAGFGEGPKQPASPWGQAPSKTPAPAAAPGAKGFGTGTSAATPAPSTPGAASPWGGAQPAPSSSAGFSGAKAPSASPIAGGKPPLAPAPASAPRGRYDNDDDVVVPGLPAANGGAASAFGAGSAAFGAPKQPQQAPSGPSGAFGSAAAAPAATGAKSGGLFAGVAPSKGPPPAYNPGSSAPGIGAPGAGAFGMTSAVQPASKPPVLVPASGGVGSGGSGAFGSKAPMAPSNGSFGTAAKNPWGNAPAGATAPPSNAARGRAPAAGRGRAGGPRSGRRSY